MDVSPQELQDSEIPSAFRGYNPEVVDDLLERAAATIESLQDKNRELAERLAAAEATLSDPRRAQAPAAAAPAPAPVAAPAPAPAFAATEDQMQEAVRTLVLAQRTADETVNEAETRAREILSQAESRQRQLVEEAEARLSDAEQRSRSVVAEAESTARAAAEVERTRALQEVTELVAARDALAGDIEALDAFASSYRARLREAIEAQLASLEAGGEVVVDQRPALSQIDLPAALDSGPPTQAIPATTFDDVPSSSSWSSFDEPPADVVDSGTGFGNYDAPVYEAPAYEAPAFGEPAFGAATPAYTEPEEPSDFGGFGGFGAPADDTPAPAPAFDAPYGSDDDPVDAETLDDDAFFASLREAVSDDAPLGGARPSSESDDDDSFGSAFKRRQ